MDENQKTAPAPKETKKKPEKPLTLQQKFVKLREAVPAITQQAHSDGVKYKFAKIFDVYKLLTPAMNKHGVNFDIIGEKATKKRRQRQRHVLPQLPAANPEREPERVGV